MRGRVPFSSSLVCIGEGEFHLTPRRDERWEDDTSCPGPGQTQGQQGLQKERVIVTRVASTGGKGFGSRLPPCWPREGIRMEEEAGGTQEGPRAAGVSLSLLRACRGRRGPAL